MNPKTKARFDPSYDLWPGNGMGLFCKSDISLLTDEVIRLKPRFCGCWMTFIALLTKVHGLCCCSSTCLQHSICSTNQLSCVG